MIVLWVRHGTVDYSKGADVLTDSGSSFARRLPAILEQAGYVPQIVFIETSKNNGRIFRCEATVEELLSELKPQKRGFAYGDTAHVINEFALYSTGLICYTSENLKFFPPIKGSTLERHMGNTTLPKPPAQITDWLYENILVTEYNGAEFELLATIPTGDAKRRQ